MFAEKVSVGVICVAAVILVSAEEVSVCVICGAGCQCPTRVSRKSVLQECQERASHKSLTRVSSKSVLQGVSSKSVGQEVSSKSVLRECRFK